MTQPRRPARTVAGLLLVGLLAACGSTVPTTGAAGGSDGLGAVDAGLGGTSTTGGPLTDGSTGAVGTTGRAAADGASTSTGATTGAVAASDLPTATGAPGIAVQAKAPVLIGLPYVNAQQSQALLGTIGTGLAPGDIKGMMTTLVNDLNVKGGILGHPAKLVTYEIDTSQSQTQYEQGACAKFTQDSKVLIALGAAASPNYLTCITKRGGAVVGPEQTNLTTATFQKLRWVLQPDAIALDRLARIQAEQMVQQGFFTSTTPVRLGVLHFETPEFVTAYQVLEKELAKRGVKVALSEAFNYVADVDDIGRTQAQVQSAVLKFRSNGITHVLAVETNAWLIGFFGVYASNQGYYPRYGYTSDEPLSNVAANVPARALEGSRFVGWLPAQDLVDVSKYPPAARACIAVLRKAGYAVDSGNQRNDALNACETVAFVKAALTAGGEPISRDSLFRGARALKTGYAPVATFQTDLSSRYDGVSSIRQGAWNSACSCFAYTSGPIPVS